jgi:hypothetical protein
VSASANSADPALFSEPRAVGRTIDSANRLPRSTDGGEVKNFGEGPDSLESDRSEYRLQSTNAVGYT